jgi:hypothetical protein
MVRPPRMLDKRLGLKNMTLARDQVPRSTKKIVDENGSIKVHEADGLGGS